MENFEKWNEEMFKKWGNEERYIKNNFIVRFVEKKRVQDLLKGLNGDEKEILEMGCGNGFILSRIKFGKKTGVDFSKTAIKSCKDKFNGLSDFEFFYGDVEKVDLKKKFDAVICSEVLEHVNNPDKAIDNMIKHSNGKILISIPNDKLTDFLKKTLIKLRIFDIFFKGLPRETNEWHIHNFTFNSMKNLLKDKVEIVKIKKSPWFFLPLKYVVYCRVKDF